jgi:hypothetical protein
MILLGMYMFNTERDTASISHYSPAQSIDHVLLPDLRGEVGS